jgi:hypothetical protein
VKHVREYRRCNQNGQPRETGNIGTQDEEKHRETGNIGTQDEEKQNWPPRYNWNIVESGVKHHKPKP